MQPLTGQLRVSNMRHSAMRPEFIRRFYTTILCCAIGLSGCDVLHAQWRFVLSTPDTFQTHFTKIIQKTPKLALWPRAENGAFELSDSIGVDLLARDLISALQTDAWLAASIDSLQCSDSIFTARLFPGPRLPFLYIDTREARLTLQGRQLPVGHLQKNKLPFQQAVAYRLFCLENAENAGHPFASVWFDSLQWRPGKGAEAVLKIDLQRFITFKGIKYKADFRIPKGYFERALGIRPGRAYSRETVLSIKNRLRTIPFAQLNGAPTVRFAGNEATVNLILQKKKAGRFDFVIGILPQSESEDARLIVNGSLDAAFHNALGLGENVLLSIDRLRPETQKLDAAVKAPYLLGSAFGLDAALHIFKRDSTWVDAQTQIGIDYLFQPGTSLTLFWENKTSSLQRIDTAAIKASRRLPGNLDFRRNTVGMALKIERLDYLYNPRSGWGMLLKAQAGARDIRRNSQIESLYDGDFDYAALYDTVQTQLPQVGTTISACVFRPIMKRGVLMARAEGGALWSRGTLLNNEAYRLGGAKRLRGFDEESLLATHWAILTAEARLITGENAYFSVFSDYAYLENRSVGAGYAQRPWGVGAGMNFETRNGVFGLTIAFGRRDPDPGFDWRSPKFHLGYISVF